MAIRFYYFSFLLVFWIICTGIYGFQKLLLLSVIGVIVSLLITYKLSAFPSRIYKSWNIISYSIYITYEMIKSALLVSAKILTQNQFEGELLELDSKIAQDSPELAIFANSITFTPGTYTISAEDNKKMIVHAFSKGIAKELKEGQIEKMVIKNFSN